MEHIACDAKTTFLVLYLDGFVFFCLTPKNRIASFFIVLLTPSLWLNFCRIRKEQKIRDARCRHITDHSPRSARSHHNHLHQSQVISSLKATLSSTPLTSRAILASIDPFLKSKQNSVLPWKRFIGSVERGRNEKRALISEKQMRLYPTRVNNV
jgi:hypothetical protein